MKIIMIFIVSHKLKIRWDDMLTDAIYNLKQIYSDFYGALDSIQLENLRFIQWN